MMLSVVSRGHWSPQRAPQHRRKQLSSLVPVLSGLSFIRFLEQLLENCSRRAKSSLLPVFKWLAETTQVDQHFELQRTRQNVPTSISSSTASIAYASLAWGHASPLPRTCTCHYLHIPQYSSQLPKLTWHRSLRGEKGILGSGCNWGRTRNCTPHHYVPARSLSLGLTAVCPKNASVDGKQSRAWSEPSFQVCPSLLFSYNCLKILYVNFFLFQLLCGFCLLTGPD